MIYCKKELKDDLIMRYLLGIYSIYFLQIIYHYYPQTSVYVALIYFTGYSFFTTQQRYIILIRDKT